VRIMCDMPLSLPAPVRIMGSVTRP
jgi:hypothetical protein